MAFDFIGLVKSVAPVIASALGGPLAGAAVSFLAGKFGTENTLDAVKQALSGMTGEQLVEMKKLDLEFQEHMAELGIKLDELQIGVNTEEAKSESVFVAGARPAIMWIGAFALAYASILEPLLRFTATVGFNYTGTYPEIDTNITMQVLFGILGLGAMRSFDKHTVVTNSK